MRQSAIFANRKEYFKQASFGEFAILAIFYFSRKTIAKIQKSTLAHFSYRANFHIHKSTGAESIDLGHDLLRFFPHASLFLPKSLSSMQIDSLMQPIIVPMHLSEAPPRYQGHSKRCPILLKMLGATHNRYRPWKAFLLSSPNLSRMHQGLAHPFQQLIHLRFLPIYECRQTNDNYRRVPKGQPGNSNFQKRSRNFEHFLSR